MSFGDFGSFGLMWILLNFFFIMVIIAGAAILTRWLTRRARHKREAPPINHEATAAPPEPRTHEKEG